MNDSQALATTKAISKAHNLTTLSELSKAAPQFRLATIQEFLARADGLPGLQKFYGGFDFKAVRTYDITLKYQALKEGAADIASAFSTDGAISTDDLVVLRDDRHFWPAYNVAPVVRQDALAREPRIATVLDALSPAITDRAAARMNAAVEGGKQDPSDVADAFLDSLRRSHRRRAQRRERSVNPLRRRGRALRGRRSRLDRARLVRRAARRVDRTARPIRVAESRRCCAP